MRTAVRWLVVALLALGVAATGGEKKEPPKAVKKPDTAKWLVRDKLFYMFHVPENYDTKERYPLIVAMPSRQDQAQRAFEDWLDYAKETRVFLAALNIPGDSKEDRDRRLQEMVVKILKEYQTIDRRAVILAGVSSGGTEVLKFVAACPHLFAAAIALSPDSFPDLKDVKPGGPRLIPSYTPIHITLDPKAEELLKNYGQARKNFARRHLRIKPHKAESGAGGKASEKELQIADQLLLERFPAAKRSQILAARRKKDATKPDDEKKPDPETVTQTDPKDDPKPPKDPDKTEPEKADPDALLMEARRLDQDRDFAGAYQAYKKLAEQNPGTDYAKVAAKRMKEIQDDPKVKQAITDALARKVCEPLLNRAGNFARNDMNDKAVPLYQKIIAEYPDSSYAERARKALERLQGEQ